MFSIRQRSLKLPACALLAILLLSFCLVFLIPPQERMPQATKRKLGPHLLSPLLPAIHRNKIPVAVDFGDPLSPAELATLETLGVRFRRVGSTLLHRHGIYVATLPPTLLTNDQLLERVERIEYTGRRLQPQVDDSVPHVNASTAWTLRHDNTSLTGKGVTIGIIDTGVDWRHPDFYFADGTTAPVKWGSDDGGYFADLNGDGGFQSAEDLEFLDESFDGSDTTYNRRIDWLFQDKNGDNRLTFGSEAIFVLQDLDEDDTLSEGDQVIALSTCKLQKAWDQTDEDRIYVRDVNLTLPFVNRMTDPEQHGTHVAGILAGGQLGFDRRFLGVAPEAELLVVKTDYEETNVIAGIQWLVQEGAAVIIMSLGGTTGYFLDGSSLLEQTIDDAGVPVVISGGNEGSFDRHAYTFLRTGLGTRRALKVDVIPPSEGQLSTVYVSVLWRKPDNPLRVYLQSPSSSMVELPGNDGIKRVGKNSASYERSESLRGTMLFDIEITHAGGVERGTWTLTLENQRDFAQPIHCWVETEAVSPTKFLDFATDQFTITNPATADTAIAVVSFNHTTSELSYFSSQGPRLDGAQKPFCVAPGEAITTPTAGTISHSDLTGVSAAAPHVAGIIALMLQADPTASRQALQERLAQGTVIDAAMEEIDPIPNALWGYGRVDALRSVLLPSPVFSDVQLGEASLQNASLATISPGNYPLTFTITDPTLFLPNVTVRMEVTEFCFCGQTPSFVYVANLTYQEESHTWLGDLTCQMNTTYSLQLTVSDPVFHSTFITNLTVVERPLTTHETTTPLTPLTPQLPEFGALPLRNLLEMIPLKQGWVWLVSMLCVLPLAIQSLRKRIGK